MYYEHGSNIPARAGDVDVDVDVDEVAICNNSVSLAHSPWTVVARVSPGPLIVRSR